MYFARRVGRKREINIVSLIDVIFFLVIFFMVFTTFRTDNQAFNLNLPKAATGEAQNQAVLTITVTQDGALFVKDQRADSALIQREVERYLAVHPQGVVILQADEAVRYRHVVQAMDAVRAAGGYRIALAVEKNPL
ncbi:MAG: biopolymer transporter ExbD [Firmicutes bacterium]|nr:biopolymer transporter ExbD [Bacillota bacterium]